MALSTGLKSRCYLGTFCKLLQVDDRRLVARDDQVRAGGENGRLQRADGVQNTIRIVPVRDAGQQQGVGAWRPDTDAKADRPQRQPKSRANRPALGSEQ